MINTLKIDTFLKRVFLWVII